MDRIEHNKRQQRYIDDEAKAAAMVAESKRTGIPYGICRQLGLAKLRSLTPAEGARFYANWQSTGRPASSTDLKDLSSIDHKD